MTWQRVWIWREAANKAVSTATTWAWVGREDRDSEVTLTCRGCQGKQGPCKAKRPLSWLAESGLKQAGPNHLLFVPRKGLRKMPRPIKDPSRADLSHKSRAILDVICFYLKQCFFWALFIYIPILSSLPYVLATCTNIYLIFLFKSTRL